MSDKLTLLENLCMKLGALPGLGFLQDFVYNAGAAKKGLDMKVGDKKNTIEHIKEIGRDAKKVVTRDTSE